VIGRFSAQVGHRRSATSCKSGAEFGYASDALDEAATIMLVSEARSFPAFTSPRNRYVHQLPASDTIRIAL
jgi:hypothetical protein